MTTTAQATLADFLIARLDEDEEAARLCAAMFPPPWEVADRGWRVRVYAADVPEEDFFSDDPDAMSTRNPVVMEVEPDRNLDDPRWLSERVEHVRRHDPARVLADCAAKRRIVERCTAVSLPADASPSARAAWDTFNVLHGATLRDLAQAYASHPDFRPEWLA